jgi:hypothetical protein
MQMNKLTKVVTVAAAFLALGVGAAAGCAGKTSSASTPAPTSQVVGSGGGTVTSSDGQVTIAIPAGALSSDVTITITPLGDIAPPGVITVGGAYQFGPPNATFAAQVTIMLPYDGSKIPAPNTASSVLVFTAVDAMGSFTRIPTRQVDASHVRVDVLHFSAYVAGVPGATTTGDGSVVQPACDNVGVFCDYAQNIDGGIGCDCNLTCNGIVYSMQCICGACACYQDSTSTQTFSLPVSACNFGGSPLPKYWFDTCNFPGAKNQMGGGGPTSGSSGGTCP